MELLYRIIWMGVWWKVKYSFAAIGVAIVASILLTGLASTINVQSYLTGGNMSMPAGTTSDDGGDGDGGDDEDESN